MLSPSLLPCLVPLYLLSKTHFLDYIKVMFLKFIVEAFSELEIKVNSQAKQDLNLVVDNLGELFHPLCIIVSYIQ